MGIFIKQKRIYRADLQANPDILYVFGDNTQRVGMGGQAGEMRGEPNAVGVATKVTPAASPGAYFSDSAYVANCARIDADLEPLEAHLLAGGTVVFPLDGIGTGLSEMPERCPKTFTYLETRIKELQQLAKLS